MSANKSSIAVDKSVLCSNRMFNLPDIYLYAPEKLLHESLLHSYDKFSMLISITYQKPKQDFLSWFSHYLYFTSLYFAKITINILHHISTFLIRSVDSSFQSQSSNRIDIWITNYIFKMPLNSVNPIFRYNKCSNWSLGKGLFIGWSTLSNWW
jgi:hypothetical protein